MAVPKWHLGATVVLMGIFVALSRLTLLSLNTLWVFTYGFLIDLDHFVQWKRVKLLVKGMIRDRTLNIQKEWHKTEHMTQEQKPPIRICHTWWGATVLVLMSWIVIKSWLPAITYGVHILIDAFNDDYFKKRAFFWEVADALRFLVPKRWRYNKR